MIFRRERRAELVADKIVTDEECIQSLEGAAHKGVALLLSELFKGRQGGTKID